MNEAYIQLSCPKCEEHWEANPGNLPAPKTPFTCNHCGTTRPTAEFARTARDFEILASFHES